LEDARPVLQQMTIAPREVDEDPVILGARSARVPS
jgi:hypothetical protein